MRAKAGRAGNVATMCANDRSPAANAPLKQVIIRVRCTREAARRTRRAGPGDRRVLPDPRHEGSALSSAIAAGVDHRQATRHIHEVRRQGAPGLAEPRITGFEVRARCGYALSLRSTVHDSLG